MAVKTEAVADGGLWQPKFKMANKNSGI